MTSEQQPEDRGIDIIHPAKLDTAASRNWATVMQELEEAPQDPEFPFFLRDKQRNFILFTASSRGGKFVGINPNYGLLSVQEEGSNLSSSHPRRIKLQTLIERILKSREGYDYEGLYARPDEHAPFIALTGPFDRGLMPRFRFPIVGRATLEGMQTATENSIEMAKRLRDEKYQAPRKGHQLSQQALDFVRKLNPR